MMGCSRQQSKFCVYTGNFHQNSISSIKNKHRSLFHNRNCETTQKGKESQGVKISSDRDSAYVYLFESVTFFSSARFQC